MTTPAARKVPGSVASRRRDGPEHPRHGQRYDEPRAAPASASAMPRPTTIIRMSRCAPRARQDPDSGSAMTV